MKLLMQNKAYTYSKVKLKPRAVYQYIDSNVKCLEYYAMMYAILMHDKSTVSMHRSIIKLLLTKLIPIHESIKIT